MISTRDENRFDRRSRLILGLGLLILAGAFTMTVIRFSLPSDGWGYAHDVTSGRQTFVLDRNLSDAPSSLQSGDVLLAIDGVPISNILGAAQRMSPRRLPNWEPGQTVEYTIRRDGRELSVQVPILPSSLAASLRSLVPSLLRPSPLGLLLLGLFLALKRPRNTAALILFLFGVCFYAADSITQSVRGNGEGPVDLFYPLLYWPVFFLNGSIFATLIAPLIAHLGLTFPVAKKPMREHHVAALALIYGGIPAVYLLAVLVSMDDPQSVLANSLATAYALIPAVIIVTLVSMLHTFRTVEDKVVRAQLRWVLSGITLSMVGGAGSYLVYSSELVGNRSLFLFLSGLFNLALPITFGIAISRYRLFDIDVILNRTLVYAPLIAIIAGLFAATVSISQLLFTGVVGSKSDAATVLTTLVVVAAFTPIKERLEKIVERRFKEAKDPAKELLTFADQVRTGVWEIDPERGAGRLLHVATHAFDAAGGAVILIRDGNSSVVSSIGEWNGDGTLRVPIVANGTQFGEVALGKRRSGSEYGPQDALHLKQAVEPIASALMTWSQNARSFK